MTTDIETHVTSWPGAEAAPHRFAGGTFTFESRELGRAHGQQQVDIPFPKRVRDVVVANGLASKHHLFSEPGWITGDLESDADDRPIRFARTTTRHARPTCHSKRRIFRETHRRIAR